MSADINTLNREKLALKQLEIILSEISCLTKQDDFYNSCIDSLCAFSRPLNDIVKDLNQLNRFN